MLMFTLWSRRIKMDAIICRKRGAKHWFKERNWWKLSGRDIEGLNDWAKMERRRLRIVGKIYGRWGIVAFTLGLASTVPSNALKSSVIGCQQALDGLIWPWPIPCTCSWWLLVGCTPIQIQAVSSPTKFHPQWCMQRGFPLDSSHPFWNTARWILSTTSCRYRLI